MPAPTIDSALAQFATGVTVVTTRTADGAPTGLTVNSFNSVSLEPPLILWSLSLKAGALPAFRDCTSYAINVLAADQLDLAKRFASRGVDRFAGTPWHAGPQDLPVINGSVATLIAHNRSQHIWKAITSFSSVKSRSSTRRAGPRWCFTTVATSQAQPRSRCRARFANRGVKDRPESMTRTGVIAAAVQTTIAA